ncbi:hypothetical protein BKA61DRAFT_680088 [Leptodontidium sp. MPI-SDFR-AT-0119]|nr:hypothetical protein BKA61DRAFT_680088 [Leptodontidium sp. MPI-SDFR-AT-0119]
MAACRRAVVRLQIRRATNTMNDVSVSPYKPAFEPGFNTDTLSSQKVGTTMTLAFNTFKSQSLKDVAIFLLGSILGYRFYCWMGDPIGILVEPNYLEWGGFMSATRLNLYRAKSFDFVVYALYITYAVNEYGFQPVLIALGSMLALVVAFLAQAMSFMDRHSPEWQRAAMTKPQSGIPEDEGILTLLSGLELVLPFLITLSWLAHRTHQTWLLVPCGPIKAACLAIVMIIPNVVVAGMGAVFTLLLPSLT